ncbi:hypothetical protein AU198_18975 [Mycobacterium sp. GA-1199]|nr:hypothetical protein AU198_18975 [Mycobacterium sp. GA-1199]
MTLLFQATLSTDAGAAVPTVAAKLRVSASVRPAIGFFMAVFLGRTGSCGGCVGFGRDVVPG